MSRLIGSLFLLTAALTVPAGATSIAGGAAVSSRSIKGGGGRVFSSSLAGNTTSKTSHGSLGAGSYGGRTFGVRSFSLRVPPPVVSETPEPSTLALFGTGLLMMGGAVRRKFRR